MLEHEKSVIEELDNQFNRVTYCLKDGDYYLELEKNLNEFINKANEAAQIELDLREMRDKILKCVALKYEGKNVEAYQIVEEIIRELQESRIGCCDVKHLFYNRDKSNELDLYRARVSDNYMAFESNEMNHIPYAMRQFSNAGRFSIPGFPCTYLGNTSFCCWIELRRPQIQKFNVSYVRLKKDLEVFNLTLNLVKNGEEDTSELEMWCKVKMLQIATTFVVKEESRSFKSEYIISQYIMQACKELGIRGIAYYSTRLDGGFFSDAAIDVLIIPEYEFKYGYDIERETDLIQITDSYNYAMYKELKNPSRKGNEIVIRGNTRISYGSSPYPIEYQYTDFYSFDKFLKRIYMDNIKNEVKTRVF